MSNSVQTPGASICHIIIHICHIIIHICHIIIQCLIASKHQEQALEDAACKKSQNRVGGPRDKDLDRYLCCCVYMYVYDDVTYVYDGVTSRSVSLLLCVYVCV